MVFTGGDTPRGLYHYQGNQDCKCLPKHTLQTAQAITTGNFCSGAKKLVHRADFSN